MNKMDLLISFYHFFARKATPELNCPFKKGLLINNMLKLNMFFEISFLPNI